MENASKALIIAGAILISIVIITLGVMIVNNVRNTISENSNLSAQEIASYNAEFEAYEGTYRTCSQVKALVNAVNAHNNVNSTDASKVIFLTYKKDGEATDLAGYIAELSDVVDTTSTSWDATEIINSNNKVRDAIKSGYTYNIEMKKTKSGQIVNIVIDLRTSNS